ncbi:MAG: type II toxin-antitoxin system VapC family toxin [Planctomycetaceae bacterium]|jgi:hypothetical protein
MTTVYVETTVVGIIAARDHSDPVVFARQTVSREWHSTAAVRYELRVSDLVVAECSAGDPSAAADRLTIIKGVPLLAPNDDAESLTSALLAGNAVPKSEPRDAAHIALAAVHGIDFLVTWNFKHILNPHTQHLIERICRENGFQPATICTPEQLMEADNELKPD